MNEQTPQPQATALTKRDLATMGLDAVDRDRAGGVAVSAEVGGISFATALEVMDFSRMMAVAGTAVPKYLRNNPGACLAVTFQAVEWRMSPFAVANKSYEVNDRVAYESQLLHALIERRAPISERLNCSYDGEGPTRSCKVIGKFTDGTEREYQSPAFKDIRVKNSPLWVADPDQQLWYYSSRAWCRKWCPDVLLGVYAREELIEHPEIGREEEPGTPKLIDRLAGAEKPGTEGHRAGHAEAELANVVADRGKVEILPPESQESRAGVATDAPTPSLGSGKRGNRTGGAPRAKSGVSPKVVQNAADRAEPRPEPLEASQRAAKAAADRAEETGKKRAAAANVPEEPNPSPPSAPTSAAEYENYLKGWVAKKTSPDDIEARWDGEREMRDTLGIPIKKRKELESIVVARVEELRA